MTVVVFKLAGAAFVILSAVNFAFNINRIYEKRCEQLQEVYGILGLIKGELSYMGETLPECFLKLSGQVEEPFCLWLKMLSDNLENDHNRSFSMIFDEAAGYLQSNTYLESDDIELIRELKDKLGNMDVDVQLKAIDYVMKRIEERRLDLNSNLKDKRKAVMSICIFTGALVLIILL